MCGDFSQWTHHQNKTKVSNWVRPSRCCLTWKVVADVFPMSPKEHQLTARARQHVAATHHSVGSIAGFVDALSRKPCAESQ